MVISKTIELQKGPLKSVKQVELEAWGSCDYRFNINEILIVRGNGNKTAIIGTKFEKIEPEWSKGRPGVGKKEELSVL